MLWRKVVGYWKSILVVGLIAYVSLLREPNVPLPRIVGFDKLVHGLMYLVLSLTLLWDSKSMEWGNGVDGSQRKNWWLIVLVLPMIYGGFIEILQEKFFYPRTGDWIDWVADCIGVLIGVGIWLIRKRWHERRVA